MATKKPPPVIWSISQRAEKIRAAFANVHNASASLIVKDDVNFLSAALSRMSNALVTEADIVDNEARGAISSYLARIYETVYTVETVTRNFINVTDLRQLKVMLESSDYFRYVSAVLTTYSTGLDSLSLALETRSPTKLKDIAFSSIRSISDLTTVYDIDLDDYMELQSRIERLVDKQPSRTETWAKNNAVHSSSSYSEHDSSTSGSIGSRLSSKFDHQSVSGASSFPTKSPYTDFLEQDSEPVDHTIEQSYRVSYDAKATTEMSSTLTGMPEIPKGTKLFSEIPDTSQLLDPHAHFTSIDDLGDQIGAILALEDSNRFLLRYHGDADVKRVHVSNSPLSSPYDIRCRISNVVRALHEMQRAGFCTDNVIFLSRLSSAPDVVQANDLSIDSIERVDNSLRNSVILDHQDIWEAIMPLMRAIFVFRFEYPNVSPDGIRSRDRDFVNHWMVALISLLEVAVLLYFHSNISSDGFRVNGKIFDGMTVPSSKHGVGFRFRRRHLTCMDHFLKAPVWVLERDDVPAFNVCDLRISAAQLADLWGPLSAVPSKTNPTRFELLRLEGGVLYRRMLAEDHPQNGPISVDDIEILRRAVTRMHFTPWKVRSDVFSAGSMSVAMELPAGEVLPLELSDFSLSDVLLIGHPLATGTASMQKTSASGANPSFATLTLSASTATATFFSDGACPLDMGNYEQENAHRIHALGTNPERLVSESYQLSLTGGQYVNVGIQKTWKKLPARTYKTMLLDYCLSPRAKVSTILDLKIGLEVSLCTGTSRRIPLLETLKIASPQDATDIDEAYATERATTIAPLLSSLEHTGVRSDGTFYAYWPGARAFPEGLKMPQAAWTCMLKDTHTGGCFATASSACLRYCLSGTQITMPMNGDCTFKEKTKYCALSTTIILNPRHSRGIPDYMDAQSKYRLSEGYLSFAGDDPSLYAAIFHSETDWTSRLRKRIKKDDEVGCESFDPRRSRYTADVCVVDSRK